MDEMRLLKTLLLLIPLGKVTTYSTLAELMHVHPRRVARLLSRNDELVIYPCHRVIMSDGRLGGYSLGTEFKKKLLELEGVKFCGKYKVCKECILTSLL